MFTLLLLRHGKSSWGDSDLSDFDRPLNKRGKGAAKVMGAYMARHGLVPQAVLCSPAKRARETWAGAAPFLSPSPEVTHDEALYDFSGGQAYRRVIRRAIGDNAPSSLMIVGHNPSIGELALMLSRDDAGRLRDRMAIKYPTAALAEIAFDEASSLAEGRLKRFVKPRDL